jgi:uncharacterized protein YbjT (DUF2867 family)
MVLFDEPSMILVIGATGKIGSETVRLLLDEGRDVRAFVRDEHKAETLRSAGARLIRGDLASSKALDEAVAGVHTMLLVCMPSFYDATSARDLETAWLRLERNAIAAAKRAGVERIVRISAIADHPIHVLLDQQLQESGVAGTILKPTVFTQNMSALAPKIRERNAIYAPEWGPQGLVDVRDIAAVAAAALTERGHEGKSYDLTGPENLRYGDIATRFSEALGRHIDFVVISAERWCRSWGVGNEWYAKLLCDRYASWIESPPPLSTAVQKILKRPPRPLMAWIKENAASFQ